MLKTFNCGIGFCLISDKKNVKKIKNIFQKKFSPYEIGKILKKIKSKFNLLNKMGKINTCVFISGKGSNL